MEIKRCLGYVPYRRWDALIRRRMNEDQGIVQRHIVTSILWFLGLNWISNARERYRPNTL